MASSILKMVLQAGGSHQLWALEPHLGLLQDQQALLITEPSLQLLRTFMHSSYYSLETHILRSAPFNRILKYYSIAMRIQFFKADEVPIDFPPVQELWPYVLAVTF